MGRKKKEKNIIIKESSPIAYSGKVIIKKVKNGKIVSEETYHNAGNTPLFSFLLNCLAGNYSSDLKPQIITPIVRKSNNTYGYAENRESIPITNIKLLNTENSNIPYIEYIFHIAYKEYLKSGIDGLALYNLAYIPNKNDILKDQDIDQNYSMIVSFNERQSSAKEEDLLIIWDLSLDNKN